METIIYTYFDKFKKKIKLIIKYTFHILYFINLSVCFYRYIVYIGNIKIAELDYI